MEHSSPAKSVLRADSPKNGKIKSRLFARIFWLAFLIVSLAYAWYSFYVPSNEINWEQDYPSAQKRASDSGKSMLLFFTAEWCVPCRIMKREVFADEQVMRVINTKFVPLMIYENNLGGEELFKRYHIEGTPITIVTDAAGNVINYAVGGISKTEFLKLINEQ